MSAVMPLHWTVSGCPWNSLAQCSQDPRAHLKASGLFLL